MGPAMEYKYSKDDNFEGLRRQGTIPPVGMPSFPVRLADEIFKVHGTPGRQNDIVLFDALRRRIHGHCTGIAQSGCCEKFVCSDIDEETIARSNLSLLTLDGLSAKDHIMK